MKILTVVGARPQFIKAALLTRRLRERHQEILVHSGQHYDYGMSGVFFDTLGLPAPDVHLGVGSGSHATQTAGMLTALEPVLRAARPDLVLVYGDTNTTLAAALTAAKLCLPIAHVEAGMRSGRRDMPEEINRVLTDRLAALLLTPTREAMDNLRREGMSTGAHWVGDLMYDLFLLTRNSPHAAPPAIPSLSLDQPFAVLTVHRAENTDDPARFAAILQGVARLPLPVVFPVHPRTRPLLPATLPGHLHILPPVGYQQMVGLLTRARLVLTDSGGVQKEAAFAGVPCVTLRRETEWPETVASGWNVLADVDPQRLVEASVQQLQAAGRLAFDGEAYGGGRAVERIVDVLEAWGQGRCASA